MKKVLFIVVTILALFNFSFSAQSCGVSDVFECPDNYTCCQGPTGRICHKIKDGVCCEDLLTSCDSISQCDNINHKCVTNPTKSEKLNFLEKN